jgi:hypothetical protein
MFWMCSILYNTFYLITTSKDAYLLLGLSKLPMFARTVWSDEVQARAIIDILHEFKISSVKVRVQSTKYVYIKATTVYVPSSELGLSQPVSRQRVCPSPQNRGGGVEAHSPAGEGLGESQFRQRKALPTLC